MRVLASSPSRISLVGGGTDVEPFASLHGGRVLGLSINLRQKIEILDDDDRWGITQDLSIPNDCDLEVIHAVLRSQNYSAMHQGPIISTYDAFTAAGLGSSAAFCVALLAALQRKAGLPIERDKIAQKAWEIETQELGWTSGKQDQWISAYGGFNLIE